MSPPAALPANATMTITQVVRDTERPAATRPLDFHLLRRLFSYTRPYAAKRNWLVLLVLIRSAQGPAIAWSIGAIINGPVAARDPVGVAWGIAGFLGLVLSTAGVMLFRQRLALEMGEGVMHDLRNEMFHHLLRLPMGFFHRTKTGRIISRFLSDVESVRSGVQDVLFVSLVQGGQMVLSATLMFVYDRVLFGIVVCLGPVLWLMNRHFRQGLSRAHRAVQESFSRVTATVAESVRGIRETQGYVRQDVNAELFRHLVVDHAQYNLSVARTTAVFFPLLELNSQLFISALVVLGGYRVIHPGIDMPIGSLIQFFFLANFFFSPLQSLAKQYNQALTAMAGAERVFRFLDTPPDWEDLPTAADLPTVRGEVEFRDVSFAYRPGEPVLRDVSFHVTPGQSVALVGHTGGGKTTIVNLIAKFYLPTRGEVRIDGQDTRRVRSEALHRHMGIVLQSNFLFSGTVIDNIRMGGPDATEEQVREAARRLDCLDLLDALPNGLQTEVGERGCGLSVGQRQVICFTRAMLADPRILILDEATSSVDVITEARLQRALGRLLEGRTSFVVAHRLSTIRHANLVLVLERGRIIERGTHRELLTAGGSYARLYRKFLAATGLAYVGGIPSGKSS